MARIVADSSADMLELAGADFVSVAMNISTNERTFTDDALLNVNEMIDYRYDWIISREKKEKDNDKKNNISLISDDINK